MESILGHWNVCATLIRDMSGGFFFHVPLNGLPLKFSTFFKPCACWCGLWSLGWIYHFHAGSTCGELGLFMQGFLVDK